MCQCSTNNCGCNDYTLPAGLTGPTGATGATGLTGPAGTNLIASIIVNQPTTTTGSYETLYTYTLSDPSPISTDGDVLIIMAYYSCDGTGVLRRGRIQFGGNTLTTSTFIQLGSSVTNSNGEFVLTRASATTAAVESQIIKSINGFAPSAHIYNYPNANTASYQTVPNLDSGAHTITFQAQSNTVGDITLDKITILKITA